MADTRAARAVAGGFLFFGLLAIAGCTTPLQLERLAPDSFPDPIELNAVAFFPQEEYQCGPAALATALAWAGIDTTPSALAPEVYLPERQGSLQLEMLATARRHGAVPYVLRPALDDLLTEVKAGHPVVVLQNLALSWYPKWHYAVVVGFDLARDEVVLRSGLERRHLVPLAVFERTWRRGDYWAVVVMPPERLPRTAQETPYLQAVVGLERIEHWQEAGRAYRSALRRWPESLGAQLGLGNSRYALKDVTGAEQAYRATVAAHPNSGIAFNNLAQALADQSRWDDAEAAVAKALALGGPHTDTFKATADEIRKKKNATADKRG